MNINKKENPKMLQINSEMPKDPQLLLELSLLTPWVCLVV